MSAPDVVAGQWPAFEVLVGFAGDADVTISPGGELDICTAPDFEAVVDAVISRGYERVVFDLSGLDFLDAAGLSVLVRSHDRLAPRGGIRVKDAPPNIYRLFDIVGLADALSVEPGARGGRSAQGLVQKIVDRVATALHEDSVEEATRHLVSVIQVVVPEADGVSVTLRRPGSFITCAANDDVATDLDHFQYGAREGPCVDAATSGKQIHAEALIADERWPAFTPVARVRGIESVLSTPVLVDDKPVGALNLYSRASRAFPQGHQELATLFASQAAIVFAPPSAGRDWAGRIDEAIASRDAIAQAQGALMESEDVGAEEAHTILRQRSVRSSTPMRDAADHILAQSQDRSPPPSPSCRGGDGSG
jgi:anti-anti-sigma factor